MGSQTPTEWIISMKEKLREAQGYVTDRPWEKWSIYRVPHRLKDAQDSKVYVPQTVSIGPYHHDDEQVRSIERHKWIALYRILERTGQDLNMFIDSIRQVEKKARSYYQQDLSHLTSCQFVEMMVLDGCFILELLRCSPKARKSKNFEVPFIFNQKTVDNILLDMIILENQVPLFILDTLLGVICMNSGNPGDHHKEGAASLALNLFNPEWLTGAPLSTIELTELKVSLQHKGCLHVLDVFRQSLLLHPVNRQKHLQKHEFWWRICHKVVQGCLKKWPQGNRVSDKKQKHRQVIHKVTELRKAGVKFKRGSTNHFWDIKFNKGVLEIPSIWIQDGTRSILLNLAAFEHCHLNISDAVIASYAVFMECLIKSSEDVSYLHRQGIIQHLLGHDDEVVDMFKSVSKEMLVDVYGGYYGKLAEEVNEYCNQRRNRWRASLIHKYFNNPWGIISLVAALILLLLTATQTFYAIYSFYKNK